jgi:hypothetical protein
LGGTQDEFSEKPANKYINIGRGGRGRVKLRKPSTAILIPLEPCALNAEFQYFISRFNKISLL